MKIYCQARDGCSTTSQSWQCSFDQVNIDDDDYVGADGDGGGDSIFIKCRCDFVSLSQKVTSLDHSEAKT